MNNLKTIGTTLASLGGLLTILSFSYEEWGLELSLAAVILILSGIYLTQKAAKGEADEKDN